LASVLQILVRWRAIVDIRFHNTGVEDIVTPEMQILDYKCYDNRGERLTY
jgi:hypothetical protein